MKMRSERQSRILLIYTGGTIGMMANRKTGSLEPFDFAHVKSHVPELDNFDLEISTLQFSPSIDSSDMDPMVWAKIVQMIAKGYNQYDGFVVLHGSDTMAYTASALSFMLENLEKPVVITGSQLPIGTLRTDGKENLITSIEIAAARMNGKPIVPEVCVFFQNQLFRGNRVTKISTENFKAFSSPNLPALAKAGMHINYDQNLIIKRSISHPFKPHYLMDPNVVILHLFPGITPQTVDAIMSIQGLKGVVLLSYGSGNAMRKQWFTEKLEKAIKGGVAIVNVTQCMSGRVDMELYETGRHLAASGVISGHDLTVEAAVTKLMFLLGHNYTYDQVVEGMRHSLSGEITV